MYPISNAAKALFEAGQRQVLRITGTDGNGNAISITEANVMIGGFNIDRTCINGNRIEIGTAIASELTLNLDNRNGQFNSVKFEGAELFVEIGIADWTQANPTVTYIPCGYFTPDEQPRSFSIIALHALDRMMRFDAVPPTLTPWTNESGEIITDNNDNVIYFLADLSFPTTVADLINQVCVRCLVPFSQILTSFPNYNYTITAMPVLQQDVTFRNIIQWCAGLMGTNAWIDWTGSLQFSWYGSTSVYTTTTANRVNSDLFEDDITLTGVQYTNTQNVSVISGTPEYALDMTGNYLAAPGISTILPAVKNVINGFTYRPFSASLIVDAPYLWPMDAVTFTDRDENNHTSVLTNVNFGINGTTELAGKGQTAQTNKGTTPSGMTPEQAFMIEKAAEATKELDESLDQEGIFNRLTDNGEVQGLYLYDGKVYINASYIQSGTMVADFIKGGLLTMGGSNNVNGSIKILDASGNTIGIWDKDGIKLYKGTIDGPSITLGGNNNADGVLTIKNSSGLTIGTWNNVGIHVDEGEISANALKGGTINGDNVNAKLLSIVDANNNVIASFGNVITLGKSDKSHAEMRQNLFAILDEGGDVYFQAGTFESSATINETIHSTTSSQRDFYTMFNIASISSLTYNGTVVSSSNISFTGNKITLSNITLATLGTVVVYYTTYDPVYYFNLGTRDSGSTSGFCSVAEGYNVEASGNLCHAEGRESIASADCSHAEGLSTKAEGVGSHAEGRSTEANGDYSHAEGISTEANGNYSHAEGNSTAANYNNSHAEGSNTTADELHAHAEGSSTLASGVASHSEGLNTEASGWGAHSEGLNTVASQTGAHAEGADTTASGNYSHAEGSHTLASSDYQHVFGRYNVADSSGTYREIVGNGTSDSNRANIRTLSATGNEWIAGTLSQGSDARQKDECGAIPDVSSIKAHRFKWNDNKINHDDLEHIGYYAQDVEEVAPYLVSEDASGNKSLDYIGFLCAKIESLEKRVKELERK